MTLIPDYYGNPVSKNYWLNTSYVNLTLSFGIAAVIFASIYIYNHYKNSSSGYYRERFFMWSLIAIYLVLIRSPITELIYRFKIPLFSTSSPTHLLTIAIFIWSILAGRGIDIYTGSKEKLRALIPTLFVFCMAYINIPFLPMEYRSIAIRNSFFSTGILFAVTMLLILGSKKIYIKKYIILFILCIVLFDRFIGFQKFNPFVPKSWVFPNSTIISYLQSVMGIDRYYGYGTARIESNIGTLYNLHSADGFGAINYGFYNGFIRSSKDGKIETMFTHINRSIAEIAPGYGMSDLPSNKFRLKILDALGVKYVLDRVENPKDNNTFPEDRFTKVWDKSDGWIVYINKFAAQRYFLTDSVMYYGNDSEFENVFFNPSFNPSESILLESSITPKIKHNSDKTKTVNLLSYEPSTIRFQTRSSTPQYLYISDTYDAGWKSFIDGKYTQTLKANYAFRAVLVPPGAHTVTMRYLPSEFTNGIIISIAGALGFIVCLIMYRKIDR